MHEVGPRIYNLFPLLAGPVTHWIDHLPRIAEMQFDWIYLNPFHEPGFSGSLYAIKDPKRLHPIVQGDSPEPPDTLLRRFTAAAEQQGIWVMMDLVINHTAKDALLVEKHPEWYVREEDGSLRSPRAVDPDDPSLVTVWGDLAEIDYHDPVHRDAQLIFWIGYVRHALELGFNGFRCDAAYQVPAEVWKLIIDAARDLHPDCVFAAETLGCTVEQTAALAKAGFDLFFNSAKYWDFKSPWLLEQYEKFRTVAHSIAFPESHDTERLVTELAGADPAEIERQYRLRYLFAAVFSTGVMMPMGYEYGFARKLHVVETRPEDWDREAAAPRVDLTGFIGATNAMKASTPALNVEGEQRSLSLFDPAAKSSYAKAPSGRPPSAGSPPKPAAAPEAEAAAGPAAPLALLRFDAAAAEQAHRCTVALINPTAATVHNIDGGTLRLAVGDGWGGFTEVTPLRAATEPLEHGHMLALGPQELRIFAGVRYV